MIPVTLPRIIAFADQTLGNSGSASNRMMRPDSPPIAVTRTALMRFAAIPPAKSADPKMSAAVTPMNTASTVDLFRWENSTVAVTIDALNALGVDASAIGTHELDTVQADFEGRVIPATKYPLLNATSVAAGAVSGATCPANWGVWLRPDSPFQ